MKIPILSLAAFAFCFNGVAESPLHGKRPNILFILTDDQGYGDLSVLGNPVLKTPNIDKFHSESVRFTNWNNSPTCSPTRSALMTGRHEFRNGVTHTIFERERLAPTATTVAQVLKSEGYSTGIFGKWHLGDEEAYRPGKRGFDETFTIGGGGIGQTFPGSCGDAPGNKYFNPAVLHNEKFEKREGYCTDIFFDEATKWMGEKRGQKEPFFCWLATNAPHAPYNARPEDRKLYEGKGLGEDTENFFGMLHNIDQNVGKLMAKLSEWGIDKNTLVVYMNDNGGTAGTKVYNANMRGIKGSPWIGGVRAISFWRWPGTLEPGDRKQLTAHIDFFKTAADLAGAELPEKLLDQSAEGRSLLPLLDSPSGEWRDRFLFTHGGRWPKGTDPDGAKFNKATVRNTQFTLVNEAGQGWQLFDVLADPAQSKDISNLKPALVTAMTEEYDAWWASLKGQYDINEKAIGPKLNSYAELYWKQFGGGPTPADYERMKPEKALTMERGNAKGKGKGKK